MPSEPTRKVIGKIPLPGRPTRQQSLCLLANKNYRASPPPPYADIAVVFYEFHFHYSAVGDCGQSAFARQYFVLDDVDFWSGLRWFFAHRAPPSDTTLPATTFGGLVQ
jgi:hypothetical protein